MLCGPVDRPECECDIHRKRPYAILTILLLDCWQREYDKRPYRCFQINKHFFEERMRRSFTDEDWVTLIEFLGKRKLDCVKISNISMPDFEDEQLNEDLSNTLLNVKTIVLRNASIPVSFLTAFLKVITSCKATYLDLRCNHLTTEHLTLLRGILIGCYTLKYLDVGWCSINDNNFAILADGVHKSHRISVLNISRPCNMSPVSIFESRKYMAVVAQLIWQNKLTEIHLRQCSLNGHDMEPLAEYLAAKDSKLLHLDMDGNNIAAHGAEYLFNSLAKSKTLRVLNLSSNNLGSLGGLVIARYISLTNIESLDITHNKIGNEIVFELLTAIKKSVELKELKMYGNEFNPLNASILKRLLRAKVIQQCNTDLTYTWDHSREELCVVPSFAIGRIHT